MEVEYGSGKRQLTGQIVDGTVVRQTFIAEDTRLDAVSIIFATYMRVNHGDVVVELVGPQGIMSRAGCVASILQDNDTHRFQLRAVLQKGQSYEIRLHSMRCMSGSAVTAKWGRKAHHGHFFIGAKTYDGELACTFHYGLEPMRIDRVSLTGSVMGLVSVVIPHLNCVDLLKACLASLARQTYGCMEVIVVDDGSADPMRVGDVVGAFDSILPSVKFRSLGANGGAPKARNVGATMASGQYLIFVDADVIMYHKAFERFVATLQANRDAAYAYCGFVWGPDTIRPRKFDLSELRRRNYISTMSMMRRKAFMGFDETLKRHQDWDLWLTLSENGMFGVCTGETLFETPRREGSISSDANIGIRDSMAIVKAKHGLR